MDAAASPTVGSYSPQTLITCQLSVDLLQVTQDFLPQHVDQPGDHLGVPPLDAVQRSLWQLGKLRVPDGVDCCGSVQVCQRLHLPAPPTKGVSQFICFQREEASSRTTHHANQISAPVLPDQLLLPIILCDDGSQPAAEHDEGAV